MSNPALTAHTFDTMAQSLPSEIEERFWPNDTEKSPDLPVESPQDYLPAGQITAKEVFSLNHLTARECFWLSREFEARAYGLLSDMPPDCRLAEIAAILSAAHSENDLRKCVERLAKANTRGRLGDWPKGKTLGLNRAAGTCYLADARTSRAGQASLEALPKQESSKASEGTSVAEDLPIALSLPQDSREVDYRMLYHDALRQIDRSNRLLTLLKPYVPIEDLLRLQEQV